MIGFYFLVNLVGWDGSFDEDFSNNIIMSETLANSNLIDNKIDCRVFIESFSLVSKKLTFSVSSNNDYAVFLIDVN